MDQVSVAAAAAAAGRFSDHVARDAEEETTNNLISKRLERTILR